MPEVESFAKPRLRPNHFRLINNFGRGLHFLIYETIKLLLISSQTTK